MKKLLVSALVAIGSAIGTAATMGCIIFMFDEPEMPESLD